MSLSSHIEHDPIIVKALYSVDSINKKILNSLQNSHVNIANKSITQGFVGNTFSGIAPVTIIENKTNNETNAKSIKITYSMIEEAYKKLKTIVNGRNLDITEIAVIVVYALQISNHMLSTNKNYKVELAVSIVRKLIDDEIQDPGKRVILHELVESSIPVLISTIDGLPGLVTKIFNKLKSCLSSK